MNDRPDTRVKATATSVRVLERVLELGTAPLTEIAREFDLSKSSVHNHLQTLERLGLVVKEDRTYRVSLRFLEIGTSVRASVPFYRTGRAEVDRLSNGSGLAAGLAVLERDEVICLYGTGGQRTGTLSVESGQRLPLHASAPGKAILAELSESRLDDVLDTVEYEQFTPETLADESALRDQLDQVRTRGVAADRKEWQTEASGLAAGFSDSSLVGSIFVASDDGSLSGKQFQQDIPGLLVSAANKVRQEMRRQ
ncbi:IclR family transcriptional regulator [Haloarcula onubensis]|uniref:IclR family transcriptional regulator n=1 Tax=Haloarcula onubensis TaxID=2950539 RepID=A0ABU2FJ06_9EURY|nr:IclR family transcriptional regulator [Halomicroarcula sp. S3CR25-11]MDS0280745.1 IclR family transcriptional regulator [Halomicroarcula sp. S3CR25-11]